MSGFLNEEVPEMPPLSTKAIEVFGAQVLNTLCPDALRAPVALDMGHLVEYVLPRYGH